MFGNVGEAVMVFIWKTAEDFDALVRRYPDQVDAARQLARTDIESGQLRFIMNHAVYYDPPTYYWSPEYHRLLKKRLGVDGWVRYQIEAPNFDAAQVFQATHYRCMVAELEARFGVGVLDKLVAEAREAYRLRRAGTAGPGTTADGGRDAGFSEFIGAQRGRRG
jgi:hypothetical protein